MAATPKLPELHVEGIDDQNSIIHLLTINGLPFTADARVVEVKNAHGIDKLLRAIPVGIKAANNFSVGFIVDIDTTAAQRWEQIRNAIIKSSLKAEYPNLEKSVPDRPSTKGTIFTIPEINARVGFWLMPDNQLEMGKLEHLLDTLIAEGDPLRAFAEKSTGESVSYGAKFPKKDQIKTILHTWLAWQEKPGLPYGTAIKAKYFATHGPAAQLFVTWCKTLFSLQ